MSTTSIKQGLRIRGQRLVKEASALLDMEEAAIASGDPQQIREVANAMRDYAKRLSEHTDRILKAVRT